MKEKPDISGFDLRDFQEGGEKHEEVRGVFGKIVSGRAGYKTILEKRTRKIKKCECGYPLMNAEKFCPECGKKCKSPELECDSVNKNCEFKEED
jgi:NADH pyrophosphatase NudC (nudix superfamily)